MRNEGEGTWNAFDVVGHLIFGEKTDWMPRTKLILEFGDSRPFAPYDRWGQERDSRGKTLHELLDELADLRPRNPLERRGMNLSEEALPRPGRHPGLGAVTLSQLLATWAAHDLTHLHQLSRILAHQYREGVGPWTAYLGVMTCDGHSSP